MNRRRTVEKLKLCNDFLNPILRLRSEPCFFGFHTMQHPGHLYLMHRLPRGPRDEGRHQPPRVGVWAGRSGRDRRAERTGGGTPGPAAGGAARGPLADG